MDFDHRSAVEFLRDNDCVMKDIIEKVGECTLKPSTSYFRDLMKSVVSQQLSLYAARTIWSRFEKLINGEFNPEAILAIDIGKFREAGLSNQKAKYVKEIALYFNKHPDFSEEIFLMSDDQVIEELTSIKGVGIWTAQMFLIFSLCRLDILPIDDVGFRRSLKLHYNIQNNVGINEINIISKRWGNYRSLAVWYLWKGLEIN